MTSGAVVLLCIVILLGMTHALFTDTRNVTNHLQAGDLAITLKRVRLEKVDLDLEGFLRESTSDSVINFTESSTEQRNVFGIFATDLIVPGCKYAATMQVENHSDAAFDYWVEVVCTDSSAGQNLAKQLLVTVENDRLKAQGLVADGVTLSDEARGCIGRVDIGESANFVVTVEFLDSALEESGIEDNNLASNEWLRFDLVVYAVQSVTE